MGASTTLAAHVSLGYEVCEWKLTIQESGEGFDTSTGIMQGHFVVHSNCQPSREDAKCHVRPEKQKVVGGSRVPPSPAHLSNIRVTAFI